MKISISKERGSRAKTRLGIRSKRCWVDEQADEVKLTLLCPRWDHGQTCFGTLVEVKESNGDEETVNEASVSFKR